MSRYVRKCLNSNCHHVFITKKAGDSSCPECRNSPCARVRRGDETSWSLKEAKKIAAMIRGGAEPVAKKDAA